MKKIELNAVIWKEGRQYVAQCLNIDIASFGSTESKALMNLQEAVELYFESTKKKPQRISKATVKKFTFAHA